MVVSIWYGFCNDDRGVKSTFRPAQWERKDKTRVLFDSRRVLAYINLGHTPIKAFQECVPSCGQLEVIIDQSMLYYSRFDMRRFRRHSIDPQHLLFFVHA